MIRLRRMDEKGFIEFKVFTTEQAAQEMCLALGIDIEDARKSAAAQTDERLSQGLDAPGRLIYHIEQQTDAGTTCIGYLTCFIPAGETFAWLSRVDVFEPYQNQGYGTQALSLLERELAEMGLKSVSVHVPAHNEHALALCQKRGFRFTGHVMEKPWTLSWSRSLERDTNTVRLQKMDEQEFEEYKAYLIEEYAQDISRSYGVDIEQARESAAEQTNEALAQGLDTPGCFVYHIELQTDSGITCIGYLQYSTPPGEDSAWLDNIDILEPHQNQGYGTQALALIEQELDAMGIKGIGLHVAAFNERALAFYRKRGFRFTGHQLIKDLDLVK
jgi:RimJ/RimL family protein N-acetyltransferase